MIALSEKLCYVDGVWAYFTSVLLSEQWGDDWGDVPYEHNAGVPYSHNGKKITKVAYDGPLYTPGDLAQYNSEYSVEDINQGKAPWLNGDKWTNHGVKIMAGVTIAEFIDKVRAAGGSVYLPADYIGEQRQQENCNLAATILGLDGMQECELAAEMARRNPRATDAFCVTLGQAVAAVIDPQYNSTHYEGDYGYQSRHFPRSD